MLGKTSKVNSSERDRGEMMEKSSETAYPNSLGLLPEAHKYVPECILLGSLVFVPIASEPDVISDCYSYFE